MRRASVRLWGLLAALLFALALVACLLLWNAPGGEWVAVERDGVELFRFRPADIEGAQTNTRSSVVTAATTPSPWKTAKCASRRRTARTRPA